VKRQAERLARLSEARRRLRDVAAGTHARADAVHLEAQRAHDDAAQALESELDGALDRLGATRSVDGLIRFVEEIGSARLRVEDHGREAAQLGAAAEESRQALRGRARELKLAERLLERQRAVMARAEQRREQHLTDERAAALGRGRGPL
jgi:hypothetical protein